MKSIANIRLQFAIQVDQHISTRNKTHSRERRILEKVMSCKEHFVAKLLLHTVAVTFAKKKSAQTLFADVGFDGGRITSIARLREGSRIKVGSKNLNVEDCSMPCCFFEKKHSD